MNIFTKFISCFILFAFLVASLFSRLAMVQAQIVPVSITATLTRTATATATPAYVGFARNNGLLPIAQTAIAGTQTALAAITDSQKTAISIAQTRTAQTIQTQTAIGASMTPINGRTQTKTRTPSRTRTPIPSRTPTVTKTTTPTAPYVRNANFEDQPNFYWAENNTGGHVIIGNWDYCRDAGCAYFGDYLNDINQRSTISQSIYIPNGKVYLGYFITASTEEIHCGFDYWYVKINSTLVQKINICNKNIPWRLYELNIRAYAGKNVTIQFGGVTDDSLKSWWRIDDIYLK